jgi:hypothetical protein
MLGNFFRKKTVQEVDVSPCAIVYLGDISGNGVDYARYELTLRASKFPMISNAWLAKVKYGSEDTTSGPLDGATHRSYTIRYEYLMARAVMQQPASIVGRDQIKTN